MRFIGRIVSNLLKAVNSHIRYQLFLSYVLVVVILLIVLGSSFYYLFTNIMITKYYQYMEQLNNQIILNLEKNIYDIERVSFTINFEDRFNEIMQASSTNPEGYNMAYFEGYETIDNFFINVFESRRELYGIYIYSLDGNNSYARNRDIANHQDVKVDKEEWFRDALEKKGRTSLLGLHENKYINDSLKVISVVRAITDVTSGKILGVIVVDEKVEQLGKIIDNIRIGDKGSVIITDNQNQLVYSNDNKIYAKLLKEDVFNKNIQSDTIHSYNAGKGKDRLVINQSVSGYTGWKVITCIPYSDLVKDSAAIKNMLILVLFACLLFTFIISVIISAKASKPLIQMKNHMESVESGNLDVRLAVTGNNEISKLGHGFNAMVARIKDLIEEEYHENLLRKEAELSLLQAQINPHFLYNTLGSIKNLAKNEKAFKVAEMVQSLSRIFRYNLGKNGNIVTVQDEIENIRNYLVLQQYRFKDKINIVYDIEEDALKGNILVMTLQPVVENAIVHGLEPKLGAGSIEIKVQHAGENTRICVKDDGVGIDESRMNKINALLESDEKLSDNMDSRSIGIFNVNARLKHRFGRQYGLKIRRNYEGGTTVEIMLPAGTK